jgi:GDP-L-fucose synthase
MPTNLYGPGDNYHPEDSHVIPALIYRFHHAKVNKLLNINIWGTGAPKREFLYVDDLARAAIHLMNLEKKTYDHYTSPMCSHINVGSGIDLSIKKLAKIIKEIVGYKGIINFDSTKPNGNPKKLLNSKVINNLGFTHLVSLEEGLVQTYNDYLKTNANI